MKQIKIINQEQAILDAFLAEEHNGKNLLLSGKVSLIGCFQPDNRKCPYVYFWRIEDTKNIYPTIYIGVFEKEHPFTENAFNRIILAEEVFFWNDEVYCYHQGFSGMEIITPFALVNAQNLRKAISPQHNLAEAPIRLYEAFDDNLKLAGHYWGICGKFEEIWLPLLPLAYPQVYEIDDPMLRPIVDNDFTRFCVNFEHNRGFVKTDTAQYHAHHLAKLITNKLQKLSDDGKKWNKGYDLCRFDKLTSEDIGSLIADLNKLYGTDYQNDGSWGTPKMLLDCLSKELNNRVFV